MSTWPEPDSLNAVGRYTLQIYGTFANAARPVGVDGVAVGDLHHHALPHNNAPLGGAARGSAAARDGEGTRGTGRPAGNGAGTEGTAAQGEPCLPAREVCTTGGSLCLSCPRHVVCPTGGSTRDEREYACSSNLESTFSFSSPWQNRNDSRYFFCWSARRERIARILRIGVFRAVLELFGEGFISNSHREGVT